MSADDEQVPFSKILLESRIATAEGKRLDREKVLRKSGTAMPASPATRTRRTPVPPAPATRSATPTEPFFHVELKHGAMVKVKVAGETHHGKIVDWSETGDGVKVQTPGGTVHARKHHLRPITEAELRAHHEREDADQEARGRTSARYGYDDLLAGMRITVVEGEHDGSGEEITGRIASIEPRDGGHVVVKSFRHGKRHLSVHTLDKIVQVHEPET